MNGYEKDEMRHLSGRIYDEWKRALSELKELTDLYRDRKPTGYAPSKIRAAEKRVDVLWAQVNLMSEIDDTLRYSRMYDE